MQTKQNSSRQRREETIYTFIREEGRWYIYLASYLQQGWSKKDLELAEGAHKVLNTISNGSKKLRLQLTLEPFEGAGVLELLEHCEAPKGGGIYMLNPTKEYSSLYWICDLALFVFGDIPERIYLKRLPLKGGEVSKGQATTAYPLHQIKTRYGLKGSSDIWDFL